MSEKWKVGDRIENRYEIHQIKKGGMGIVYLSYDHESKNPVAIKTFQDKYLTDKASIDRFMWEAETWVRLEKHKNIVRAHYVHNISDRPYVFLEFVPGDKAYGADLTGWIRNNALDLNTTLSFAIQFCLGMEHAEKKFREMGKPFIHRDIKPGNIMVTQDKVVKVTDFGLVKTFMELGRDVNVDAMKDESTGAERCGFSVAGEICGTPPYMSPEQCRGEDEIDTRSDIYSFGCVLYEMLTGKRPFEGPTGINYLAQHLKEIPVPPKKIKSDISDVLNNLVMRCLEKESERRYQDFKKLRGELCDISLQMSGERFDLEETPQELDAWELVNRGISLSNLGKPQEAIVCYDRALDINPKFINAWINKGVTLEELDQYHAAMECINKALEINHRFAVAWRNKGNILGKLGKHQEAITCYETALEINPKYTEAWVNKGIAFMNLGRYQDEIACCDHALQINSVFTPAWLNKGAALAHLGDYQEAIVCLNRVLEMYPRDVDAWFNKGTILANLGRNQEAVECYNMAIETNPRHEKVWYNKGNSLRELGKLHEAITCYDRALEVNSKYEKALYNKGSTLWSLGKRHEAITCYDKALEINPKYLDVLNSKGIAFMRLGNYQEAIQCFDKVLEIDSKNADSWRNKGVSLNELGRYSDAINAFQDFIKYAPSQYANQVKAVEEFIKELK